MARKSLVYEIKENEALQAFYQVSKAASTVGIGNRQYGTMKQFFYMAGVIGHTYIDSHRLIYKPIENQLETAYTAPPFTKSADDSPPESHISKQEITP